MTHEEVMALMKAALEANRWWLNFSILNIQLFSSFFFFLQNNNMENILFGPTLHWACFLSHCVHNRKEQKENIPACIQIHAYRSNYVFWFIFNTIDIIVNILNDIIMLAVTYYKKYWIRWGKKHISLLLHHSANAW